MKDERSLPLKTAMQKRWKRRHGSQFLLLKIRGTLPKPSWEKKTGRGCRPESRELWKANRLMSSVPTDPLYRFLHMLSRERDQLGSSIRQVERPYIESLDRKKDSELNLASHVVYDEIEKTVVEGDWDGYHGGFPCSSFSRVRWRDWPGGAHPVRSAAHIYGLPIKQKEADEGRRNSHGGEVWLTPSKTSGILSEASSSRSLYVGEPSRSRTRSIGVGLTGVAGCHRRHELVLS